MLPLLWAEPRLATLFTKVLLRGDPPERSARASAKRNPTSHRAHGDHGKAPSANSLQSVAPESAEVMH